jgi:hypothetical protein
MNLLFQKEKRREKATPIIGDASFLRFSFIEIFFNWAIATTRAWV